MKMLAGEKQKNINLLANNIRSRVCKKSAIFIMILAFSIMLFACSRKINATSADCFSFSSRNPDPGIKITGYDFFCGVDVSIPDTINNLPVVELSANSFSHYMPQNKFKPALKSVIIPHSVEYIGKYAFQGNEIKNLSILSNAPNLLSEQGIFSSNHIEDLIIPDGIEAIGSGAFYANRITNLQLPKTLLRIDSSAFTSSFISDSGKTLNLEVPAKVESISDWAFANSNLNSEVYFLGDTAPKLVKRFSSSSLFGKISQNILIRYNCEATGFDDTMYKEYNRKPFCNLIFFSDGQKVNSKRMNIGDKISVEQAPAKPGYNFVGWYSDENFTQKFDFSLTMPNQNLTLYAKWEKIPDQSDTNISVSSDELVQGNENNKHENLLQSFKLLPPNTGWKL